MIASSFTDLNYSSTSYYISLKFRHFFPAQITNYDAFTSLYNMSTTTAELDNVNFNIKRLEAKHEVNTELYDRLNRLIPAIKDNPTKYLGDVDLCIETAKGESTKERPLLSSVAPPFSDMIESIVVQTMTEAVEIGDPEAEAGHFVKKLEEQLNKVEEVIGSDKLEYDGLIAAKARLERAIESTAETEKIDPSADQMEKPTPMEAMESDTQPKPESSKEDQSDDIDTVHLLPATIKFGEIKIGDYATAQSFITAHPEILTDDQKDALMMKAFEQELAGDTKDVETLVHNALLLQYCLQLESSKWPIFFHRVGDASHPAHKAFMSEVDMTVEHIRKRCKLLNQPASAATPNT